MSGATAVILMAGGGLAAALAVVLQAWLADHDAPMLVGVALPFMVLCGLIFLIATVVP